jgi:tRNA pseudouridine32 synthase/23S rRNA pseudouridine746 synthase
MPPVVFKKTVATADIRIASDLIAAETGLSKTKVKQAMIKGAVWLRKVRGKRLRLRRATAALAAGDTLEMFYDESILARIPPAAELLTDKKFYSVWFKPAQMMTQGSNYGDHCSLLRVVERNFPRYRPVYPVHRLDREVPGVVVVAHSRNTARQLSILFQNRQIIKRYRAEVLGDPNGKQSVGRIDFPLDGKSALTEFTVTAHSPTDGTSTVDIRLITGRRHQLWRHFEMIGHPIMGDPLYGKGNKNPDGLKLTAISLEFRCPVTGERVIFANPEGSETCELIRPEASLAFPFTADKPAIKAPVN